MFESIRNFFLKGTDLVTIARGTDRDKFTQSFLHADLTILSLPPPFQQGIDPNISESELLAAIEVAAKELSTAQGHVPFSYEIDGQRRLPIFSRQKHVEEFVQWYVNRVNRIVPFQSLTLTGNSLAPALSDYQSIVINDTTRASYVLTSADIKNIGSSGK